MPSSRSSTSRACSWPVRRSRIPRPAGLALEKLITDRTGEKGDRDLLVVAGLLSWMRAPDLDELARTYEQLSPELRHQIRTNLSILSLLEARPAMPDPRAQRALVAQLLEQLAAP